MEKSFNMIQVLSISELDKSDGSTAYDDNEENDDYYDDTLDNTIQKIIIMLLNFLFIFFVSLQKTEKK